MGNMEEIKTGGAAGSGAKLSEAMGLTPPKELPQVFMRDLNFDSAPVLKPIGFRFIVPVPDLGSENRTIEVTNWKGEKEVIVGYGFLNAEDTSQQAVRGDGQGVLIVLVNIDEFDRYEVSKKIHAKIANLGGTEALTVDGLDSLLQYIREDVGIKDIYNSEDSIAQSMVAQGDLGSTVGRPVGLFEKLEKAGPVGVYVPGASRVMDGPHAGTAEYDEKGFIAVRIPPKKEGDEYTYRSISVNALTSCYMLASGERLNSPSEQLPLVKS